MPTPDRSTLALLALAAAPAVALAGCVGGAGGADASYSSHDVHEWKRLLEESPGAFLLDVRTPQEFMGGHLAGATLIPHTDVRARSAELPADKDAPIFVYCRSGSRSAVASEALADLGYSNVHNLEGGIRDWVAAGYPVVR